MTTRLRDTAPCARAMSTRNAGAAKLSVNAATPSRMNSRRVTLVAMFVRSLHELIFAGSGDQARKARCLRIHLRIGAGPRLTGGEVAEQLRGFVGSKRRGSHSFQHRVEHACGLRALCVAERAREIEFLVRRQHRGEVHSSEHL